MAPRFLLLARGAFNLLFGIGLYVWLQGQDAQRFAPGGTYALIDGFLGLLLAFALRGSARGRWLFGLVLCDGLLRLLIGAMIFANPGLQQMVLGSVFVHVLIIFACGLLGLGGIVYLLVRRPPAGDPSRGAVGPALAICIFTFLLGVGLAYGLLGAAQVTMLALYALLMGIALLYAGWRSGAAVAGPPLASP
ncbi:hypothetical protein QTH87_24540 [Variovorax sp. J22P168]|uniref:hypothetical protein n=1 Tax=Variovorax jilinensis TaxID=3053513 RepID=UPI0025776849|nr:hypothetical protein [Variovorax sp. J22P168]MDM0015629.1 hypothetical protein [Variovorax sp. J22P168]